MKKTIIFLLAMIATVVCFSQIPQVTSKPLTYTLAQSVQIYCDAVSSDDYNSTVGVPNPVDYDGDLDAALRNYFSDKTTPGCLMSAITGYGLFLECLKEHQTPTGWATCGYDLSYYMAFHGCPMPTLAIKIPKINIQRK